MSDTVGASRAAKHVLAYGVGSMCVFVCLCFVPWMTMEDLVDQAAAAAAFSFSFFCCFFCFSSSLPSTSCFSSIAIRSAAGVSLKAE